MLITKFNWQYWDYEDDNIEYICYEPLEIPESFDFVAEFSGNAAEDSQNPRS